MVTRGKGLTRTRIKMFELKIKGFTKREEFGRNTISLFVDGLSKFYHDFSLFILDFKVRKQHLTQVNNSSFFINPFITSFPFLVFSAISKTAECFGNPLYKRVMGIDDIDSSNIFSGTRLIDIESPFAVNYASKIRNVARLMFDMSGISHMTKYTKDVVNCLAATTKFWGSREAEAIV